jgi:hypothetical protein
MKEGRDLAVTLVGATLLMLSVAYLTQCSARTRPPEPAAQTSIATQSATRGAGAARRDDDEEAVRVKSIGHALQTIGADPVLRKTYGFDAATPSSAPPQP